MKPVPAALWIAKFVTALFLLLVVVPAGLFFGGVYAWSLWEDHKAAVTAKHQAEFNTEKSKAIAEADAKEDAKLPPLPSGYEFSTRVHSDQLQNCLDAISYSAPPKEINQSAVKAAVMRCFVLDDAFSKAVSEADVREAAKASSILANRGSPPIPPGFVKVHSDQLQSCLGAISYSAPVNRDPIAGQPSPPEGLVEVTPVEAAVSRCFELDHSK